MHIIFQRHHLPPDDFLLKPKWAQAFMLESMKIQLRAEEKRREGTEGIEDEEEGGERFGRNRNHRNSCQCEG